MDERILYKLESILKELRGMRALMTKEPDKCTKKPGDMMTPPELDRLIEQIDNENKVTPKCTEKSGERMTAEELAKWKKDHPVVRNPEIEVLPQVLPCPKCQIFGNDEGTIGNPEACQLCNDSGRI